MACISNSKSASTRTSDFPDHPSGPETTDPTRIDPSRTYCDARLSHMEIRRWTDVRIGNGLAAEALSFYLETDYPIHGLFDVDLFLHDLVAGEHNFCSEALVNAVLAWSCVSRPPNIRPNSPV